MGGVSSQNKIVISELREGPVEEAVEAGFAPDEDLAPEVVAGLLLEPRHHMSEALIVLVHTREPPGPLRGVRL